ncbi:hypothetical protein RSJ42_03000 [Methanosarcina hadiensis]|uniref:hypothetical protein n=1 Tax=Methanosarcina hadiensis TaxID=3078083 RepID=UPI0039775E83
MTLTLNIKGDFTPQEVTEVIRAALDQDERAAKYRIEKYSIICKGFEVKYGMGSDLFIEKFEAGKLGDDSEFFDWYAAKKGLDMWDKRLKIISAIDF